MTTTRWRTRRPAARAAYKPYVPDGLGLSSMAINSRTAAELLAKVAPTWPDNAAPDGKRPRVRHRDAGRRGQFGLLGGRNEYHCTPGCQPG